MYNKYIYKMINWLNKSESLTTPLGKHNLNHMDSAIYNIAENLDVVYTEMDSGKFNKSDADKVIVGMPTWNPTTGLLTFKFYDGTTFQVDFNVEKIPVAFSMNSAGVITMTTSDGTKWTADIGDVIPTYTYVDSDTIAFSDTKNGNNGHRVSAQIKKNSIKGEHLQPDYLADVTTQANRAAASAQLADDYAENAANDALLAQSYSVGGSGIREGEDTDSAKFYKEEAEKAAKAAESFLDGMQDEQAQVTVDSELSSTSENPVQNKVLYKKISNIDNTADSDKSVASATTATKLSTSRAIDGVFFNGSAAITHYGTCSTAAGTRAKTVSLPGFTLVTGARISVHFSYTNTAESATLNVNGTGAKTIHYHSSAIMPKTAGYLEAGGTYEFVYSGTYWEIVEDPAVYGINNDLSRILGPYHAYLNKKTTVTNGSVVLSLSVPLGTYLILAYCAGATAWFLGEANTDSYAYGVCAHGATMAKYINLPSATNNITMVNLNGADVTYSAGTMMVAFKLG